ncbi:coiled-coil domain-containing protein 170 [Gouania willdenowi]|uniref:coiled-coil domain-containing protein 170 n=1 Tax=Gouania willdenowi TaxID=441366 RepID=UPI001054BA31|nr:coiled-coil domain-containing protein 170-like [Gouania willdenowi]
MEGMENSDERNEKERLRMRIAVLEESVRSCEVDCRASRETVVRLETELDQERRKSASSAEALHSLKVAMEDLSVSRRSVEREKQMLMERLDASLRVIEAARKESKCLENQVEELERKTHITEGKLHKFRQKVAELLQRKSEQVILPREEDILHNVDNLCNKILPDFEAKLYKATEELSQQTVLQHSTEQRAHLAEQQLQELRERLRSVETELLSADVHRDRLQHNRQHYEEFLEQLSETMKVESIALDLDFNMKLKLILSRAEQLIKQEGTSLLESKSLTYTLQRKVKLQKDQLESKELHIQLLRKKVSELEDVRRSQSVLSVERDDANVEVRRLKKKLERLQGELKVTKQSNTELKNQLTHTNELQLKVLEQSQSMQEQSKKLEQLEDGKVKVEKKLNTMSSDLQNQEKTSREDQQQLYSLKQNLAQLSEQHRDLVDFRMVVSQMLGLDTTALEPSNLEIIKVLESLIPAHYQHHHCQ